MYKDGLSAINHIESNCRPVNAFAMVLVPQIC